MIRVLGLMRDEGACMLYRVKQPLSLIKKAGLADVSLCGVGADKNISFESAMLESDVIHVPRVSCDTMHRLMETLQPLGKKIIIDHDDDIFNVNPFSPWYRDFGTKEVKINIDGKEEVLWKNGTDGEPRSIDIEANIEKMQVARECLRMADAVTVTTKELADVYSEYNHRVYTLPNCIDFNHWLINPKENEKVKIIWQGGDSHYQDLISIKKPLINVLNKYKEFVQFILCGEYFEGFANDLPSGIVRYYPWISVDAHSYRMSALNADIGIVPIIHDKFNAGKSPIKFHEYSAIKTATLASDYPPYSKVIEDGVNGYLFKTEQEFEEKLLLLIGEKQLRSKLANRAYHDTHKNYNAEDTVKEWMEVYSSVYESSLAIC
tara:strand:- start:1120 stop:2250 length:1131 start_codon:yes stop_codon:yes gene_type:complete